MEALLIYSLSLWMGFFLFNYADISRDYARFAKEALGPKWGYPLSCALCFAVWITFAAYLVGLVPVSYVFAAPVVHLFIDLIYTKLTYPAYTITTSYSDRSETLS